jgi:acetoin utilization protein AcuB
MFAGQLISNSVPQLHFHDKVSKALQNMNDFHVSHLPVAFDDKYLGLISESDLLDADEDNILESLHSQFIKPFVRDQDHFLLAVKVARDMHLSVVPVINEEYELLGVIVEAELVRQLATFTGAEEQGGLIMLEMERKDFSTGELNRMIESNDAYLTQLNTWVDPVTKLLLVTIRINKLEVSDIVATLQRHEYNVKYYHGEELYRNELQNNLEHLMNYLGI